jgi:hypothetical protein
MAHLTLPVSAQNAAILYEHSGDYRLGVILNVTETYLTIAGIEGFSGNNSYFVAISRVIG